MQTENTELFSLNGPVSQCSKSSDFVSLEAMKKYIKKKLKFYIMGHLFKLIKLYVFGD